MGFSIHSSYRFYLKFVLIIDLLPGQDIIEYQLILYHLSNLSALLNKKILLKSLLISN